MMVFSHQISVGRLKSDSNSDGYYSIWSEYLLGWKNGSSGSLTVQDGVLMWEINSINIQSALHFQLGKFEERKRNNPESEYAHLHMVVPHTIW